MAGFEMIINGASVAGTESYPVDDPATGKVFAEAPNCSSAELDDAMAAAASALSRWGRSGDERVSALRAGATAIRSAEQELAELLTAEQGKPLLEAHREVLGMSEWFDYFAGLDLPPVVIQDDQRARVQVVRRPVGVVAAITPWNFPLGIAGIKLAPALRAGATVVLKPSPYTPLATLRAGQILNEVLPPGVLNVVSGGDTLGRWMTTHPVPRKVSFTGSVAAGRDVARAAADLKHLTLELGGNDPAILLDDVDPEAVAGQLIRRAFYNTGQVCVGIKRVYVPRSIFDPIVAALAEQTKTLRVGAGRDAGVDLGPLTTQPQLERVEELVADALRSGGEAVAGGSRIDRDGYFYQPTILTDVGDSAPIVAEEQFGPALPVLPYDDLDEAVERANATDFGLSGSVWSDDPEHAEMVARRLECGTVWVNTHAASGPHLPLSGTKQSGLGVENGQWGLEQYTQIQVVHSRRPWRTTSARPE